jgi:isopenicillin N synthase-like dioxygenase
MDLTSILPKEPLKDLVHNGFLLLSVPHTIAESMGATFAAGYTFFRQEENTKKQFIFEQDLGYRPFAGEYSVSAEFPDQLESYSVSPRLGASPIRLTLDSVAMFHARMMEIFRLMEPIVEGLTILLADQIGAQSPITTLKGKLRRWSRLQANYARPAEVGFEFINETHEDLDLLTLTSCPQPGLEVKMGKRFVPMQTTSHEILIFPGEIAWLLSGGAIKPMYHRVRTHSHVSERLALLFFADVEPDSCEPWVITNVNTGVDIAQRVRTNVRKFGLKGFHE